MVSIVEAEAQVWADVIMPFWTSDIRLNYKTGVCSLFLLSLLRQIRTVYRIQMMPFEL